MKNSSLIDIASRFLTNGTPADAAPFGDGLINDTFLITCTSAGENAADRYILQKINTSVFRDPVLLQENLALITRHIKNILEEEGADDIKRKVLTAVPAKNGGLLVTENGEAWRMTVFIENSVTLTNITPTLAGITGKAFARFHSFFARPDAPVLRETIPDFHNLTFRIRQLKEAVAKDSCGRLEKVRDIVDYLLSREEEMTLAERLYADGLLPKRISHCDTKIDNILFDTQGNILCVIDLDTTMPGFVMSDFGDFIRTAANKGKEDDPDTGKVILDMDIFREFAKGYLSGAGFLNPTERKTLPYGAQRLTYMQTVRFLTDYINGDTYYKTAYPEHNLVRTRAQLKLLKEIDSNLHEMEDFIENIGR